MLLLVNFSRSRKAQSGTETFVAVFVLGLIILYTFVTYVDRNREVQWSDSAMQAQRECYSTAETINRVRSNGYGFLELVSFTHRVKIYGNDRGMEVFFDNGRGQFEYYYCTFSTSNVTNTTDYTFETSARDKYKAVNEGNDIVFYKI